MKIGSSHVRPLGEASLEYISHCLSLRDSVQMSPDTFRQKDT